MATHIVEIPKGQESQESSDKLSFWQNQFPTMLIHLVEIPKDKNSKDNLSFGDVLTTFRLNGWTDKVVYIDEYKYRITFCRPKPQLHLKPKTKQSCCFPLFCSHKQIKN